MRGKDPYIEFLELMASKDFKIDALYDEHIEKIARAIQRYGNRSEGLPRPPMQVDTLLDKQLQSFRHDLFSEILEGIKQGRASGHSHVDRALRDYIETMRLGAGLKETLFESEAPLRLPLLNTPLERGAPLENGKTRLKLSRRVWKLTRQNKLQIKTFLEEGLHEGSSAASMARDLKQFLECPDKLFRRIKNEKGQLEWSKAAREYHPGAGVYRSSHKNALRLSRTEVNMAYRKAEHERWQALPFVLGMEIRLSKAHKEGACLCDHLQGKYPKNFLFLGWHPQCLCQAVPVMLSREEFIRYGRTGRIEESRYIREIPKKAQEYLNAHAERIMGWKNRPYFIESNFRHVEGKGFIFKGSE